jgi:amidohydrolase
LDIMTVTDLTATGSLVALRRDLHRMPELRFKELRTAQLLSERLSAAGFGIRDGICGTGLMASLGNPGATPHVVLRADMDAVPTSDLTAAEYASIVPGVAHACGHDVHMAVVVGAAERLAADGGLCGRLTILLQPAEEIPFGERSGARAMLEVGVLDEPVDAILGLHCWPSLPAGVVGLDGRVAMAAKDAFRIRMLGSSAHAATPSSGKDAILAIGHLVVGLHHLVGREVDPGGRVALNVGTIQGGVTQSVVPAQAEVTGTIRSVDPTVHERIRASIERVASAAAGMVGATADVEWANEMPPVINDPHLVAVAREVLPGVLGPGGLRSMDGPPMTTDDFALFAERVPGLYLKLGVASPGAASWPSLHDGRFDVDETSIDIGVDALVALARELLARGSREEAQP